MCRQLKQLHIAPASAAIVMAMGIFLLGAIEAFPQLDTLFGKALSLLLCIIAFVIYALLVVRYLNRSAFQALNSHPLLVFTIGTWIAGLSVLGNVLYKYYPSLIFFVQFIAMINVALLFIYIFICCYHLVKFWRKSDLPSVHGVILLSTVSVQSVVILLYNTWEINRIIAIVFILLGLFFYFVNMLMIVKRYLQITWTLVDDWTNTNCIIHGALSITGLAMVTTMTFHPNIIFYLWWVTFILLLIVESVEIIRAIQRVRLYGWEKGIFTYEVTQWSRNFTFGMFFAYTWSMHQVVAEQINHAVLHFQQLFLSIWAWFVLILLLIQIGIFIKTKLSTVSFQSISHNR